MNFGDKEKGCGCYEELRFSFNSAEPVIKTTKCTKHKEQESITVTKESLF